MIHLLIRVAGVPPAQATKQFTVASPVVPI